MANGVEERIVAAKFDSSDFEKGVDKTVKKLDELKESLDMKKAGEVLEKASEKANKSMDSLSKSVENLNNRFTSFWGMVKQNIVGGLAQKVSDVFMNMTNSVTGFIKNMTTGQMAAGMQKFESILTSVRMITNATYLDKDKNKVNYSQDAAYEAVEKLQNYADETSYSMDQMTDSMSKMVAAGVKLEDAQKNVQGIANACAAAGVNATDAARAFFNLSQAYSSGSLKYTDYRSLELLNMTNQNFEEQLLAAGVASGTLTEKKDKNGNMTYTTKKTDKNGKVTAGKKFTRQGLAESLKYGWAGTDVMDALFGDRFYVDVEDFYEAREASESAEGRIAYLTSLVDSSKMTDKEMDDLMKSLDETDERRKRYFELTDVDQRRDYLKSLEDESDLIDKLPKKYSEVAAKAFLSAREARNFNDVINAIGDYVSSKWAKVYQTLFGRLEEAAEFFTKLSEGGIAGFFTDTADRLVEFTDALNGESGSGGRAFRQIILELDAALGELLGIFGDLIPASDELGHKLNYAVRELSDKMATIHYRIEAFRKWLNNPAGPDGLSRLERIQLIISNISGAFSAVGKIISIVVKKFEIFETAGKVLNPIFMALTDALIKATKPIDELGNGENTSPFESLTNGLLNLKLIIEETMIVIEPFILKFGNILGEIGKFIVSMSIDTVTMNIQFFADIIRLIIDLFGTDRMKRLAEGESVIEGIKNDIQSLIDVCKDGIGAVGTFLSSLIKDIRTLLGLSNEGETSESGEGVTIWSNIKNFFDTNEFIAKVKAWFEQAKVDVKKWIEDVPTKIKEFISGLLTPKKEETITEGSDENKTISAQLKEWFDGIVNSVKEFVLSIPERIRTVATELGDMAKSFIHNLLYDKITVWEVDEKGNKTNPTELEVDSPIKIWFEKLVNSVREFIVSLPSKIKTLASDLKEAVKKWIHGLFYDTISVWDVDEKGRKTNKTEVEVDSPLKIWLTKFINDTKEFIRTLPGKIKALASNLKKSIQKYIHGLLYKTVYGLNEKGYYGLQEVPTQLKVWIDNLVKSVKNFITKIPEHIQTAIKAAGSLGRSIIDAFKGLFGFKDAEKAVEEDASRITFDGVIDSIKSIAKTLINEIISLFTGTDDMEENFKWFGEQISGFISQIPDYMRQGLGLAITGIGNIWDTVYNLILGEQDLNGEGHGSKLKETIDKEFGKDAEPKTIVGVLKTIPDLLSAAFKDLGDLLRPVWDELYKYLMSDKIVSEKGKGPHETSHYVGVLRQFGVNLANGIVHVFQQIPGWITTGITQAVEWINTAISGATSYLTELTEKKAAKDAEKSVSKAVDKTGESAEDAVKKSDVANNNGGLGEALRSIGQSLYTLIIETIPAFISAGWEYLRVNVGTWFDGFLTIFDGIKPDDPEFENTKDRLMDIFSGWWDSLMNITVGTKDVRETPNADVFETVPVTLKEWIEDFITNLPNNLLSAFETAKQKISELWNSLGNIVVGEEIVSYYDDGKLQSKSKPVTLREAVRSFIIDLPKNIRLWIGHVGERISSLWNNFLNIVVGNKVEHEYKDGSLQSKWVPVTIRDAISKFITELPTNLTIAIGEAKQSLTDFWNDLVKAFNGEGTEENQGSKGFETSLRQKVIGVLVQLPGWIADGFALAIKGISDVIEWVTNWFDTEVEKAMTSDEGLSKSLEGAIDAVVEESNQAVANGTASADEETPKNNLLRSLSSIGETFWKLITETVPGFISSGFNWVRTNWDKKGGWKESLLGIFSNLTGLDPTEISLGSIATAIWEALARLPEIIRSAIKWVKKKIFKQEEPIIPYGQWYTDKKTKEEAAKAIIDTKDEIEETVEKSGFVDSILGFGNEIGAAIQQLVENIGLWILNGLDSALKLFNKLITGIIKYFIGEKKELGTAIEDELDGESPEVKKALNGIGTSLENFFVHNLPRFIASALGAVIHALPTMIAEFWDAFTKAFETGSERAGEDADKTGDNVEAVAQDKVDEVTSEVVQNLTTMGGKINKAVEGVFNFVFNEDGTITEQTKWFGALALLIILLDKVSGLISSIKNKSKENSADSLEGVMRMGLTAFMVVLAFCAWVSKLNTTELEQTERMLDKVMPIVEKILNFYQGMKIAEFIGGQVSGITTALSAGAGGLISSKLFGSGGGPGGGPGPGGGINLMNGLKGMLSGWLGAGKVGGSIAIVGAGTGVAIESIGGAISSVITQITTNFEEIAVAVASVVEVLDSSWGAIDALFSKIDTMKQLFGSILDLFANYIAPLSGYRSKSDDLNYMLLTINPMISLFTLSVSGDNIHADIVIKALEDIIGMTNKMEEFVKFTEETDTFERFKHAIASLGTSLKFYNDVNVSQPETISETGIQNAVKVLKAILGDDELTGLAENLLSESGIFGAETRDLYTASENLSIFASALSQIGSSLSGFDTTSSEAFKAFLEALDAKIDWSYTQTTDDKTVTFAGKLAILGEGLKGFAQSIAGINEGDVKTADYALTMLARISERLSDAGKGILASIFTGSTDLGEFGLKLGSLGVQLRRFYTSLTYDSISKNEVVWNVDLVRTAIYALRGLSAAAVSLHTVDAGKLTTLLSSSETVGQSLHKFLQGFIFKYRDDVQLAEKIDPNDYDFTFIGKIIEMFSQFAYSIAPFDKNYNVKATFEALENQTYGLQKLAETAVGAIVTMHSTWETVKNRDANLDDAKTTVDMVTQLITAVSTSGMVTVGKTNMTYLSGDQMMRFVMEAMQYFSEHMDIIETFLDDTTNVSKNKDLQAGIDMLEYIALFANTMAKFSPGSIYNGDWVVDSDAMSGFNEFAELQPKIITEALSNFFSGIDTFVNDPTYSESVKTYGTSIAKLLFDGIQAAFSDPEQGLQPTITPVLNMDDIHHQMAEFFGADANGEVQFNMGQAFTDSIRNAFADDENKIVPDYTSQLVEMSGKIDTLDSSINSLSRSMTYLKIYMDTGVLVGEIAPAMDMALGSRQQLWDNHIADPVKS